MNTQTQLSARHPTLLACAAAVVAALALWLSRASFDLAGTAASPTRVAMLPSLPELAGLIVLSLLLMSALAWMLHWDRAIADISMPLFGLALLALPYLPWLADWFPALRPLAEPAGVLVWVIVTGHVVRLFAMRVSRPWFSHVTLFRAGVFLALVVVFCVSLAIYTYATSRLGASADWSWPPVLAAATVGTAAWWGAAVFSRSISAATFSWAAVFLSVPFVLNSGVFIAGIRDAIGALQHLPAANFRALTSSGPGLLFDQEFGIVPYAPVLVLVFIGLIGMVRARTSRTLGFAIGATLVAIIILGGSVEPWWSESIMPGRRVLLLLPFCALPLAWMYAHTSNLPLGRAALTTLLLASLGLTCLVLHAIRQAPFPQEGDGSSSLLQWMSQTWHLWHGAPSYVFQDLPTALARTSVWLVTVAAGGWVLSRRRVLTQGQAALGATFVVVLGTIAAVSASAALPWDRSRPGFDAEGRVLFPLLETFDPAARPISLQYDPFSIVSSGDIHSLFALTATPQQRLDRQPLRVVLNARFRLPAGEYVVDFTGSELAGTVPSPTIGLQIGREGRPLEVWPLSVTPGGHEQRRFRVPLDAEFVGFRASRQVERTIAGFRVTPLTVVPARLRFSAPTVRSAASYEPVTLFFHDADAYPEPDGLWIKGQTTARLTLLKVRESDPSISFTIHSGSRANVVHVSTGRWSTRLDLAPGVTETVTIPSGAGESFIPLSITTAGGFVPAEVSSSTDRRLLGAWIAFKPADIARTSASP